MPNRNSVFNARHHVTPYTGTEVELFWRRPGQAESSVCSETAGATIPNKIWSKILLTLWPVSLLTLFNLWFEIILPGLVLRSWVWSQTLCSSRCGCSLVPRWLDLGSRRAVSTLGRWYQRTGCSLQCFWRTGVLPQFSDSLMAECERERRWDWWDHVLL